MGYCIFKNRIGLLAVLSFTLIFTKLEAQTNVSGNITTNTTWNKAGSPYYLTNNILVDNGATLTIEPGVVVEAKGHVSLNVLGSIVAVGTQADSIYFKGNGTKGYWIGIKIRNTGGSVLNSDYTYASGSKFLFASIADADNAIYQYNCSLYVSNSTFNNNAIGIEQRSSSRTLITDTKFSNNNEGGYVMSINEYLAQRTDNPSDIASNISNLKYDYCDFDNNNLGIVLDYQNAGIFDGFTLSNSNFKNNYIGLKTGNEAMINFQNSFIYKNKFISNTTGINFMRFGSGANHLISSNLFYDNITGIDFNWSNSPIEMEKNIFFKNANASKISSVSTISKSSFIDNKSSISLSLEQGTYFGFNENNCFFSDRAGASTGAFIKFDFLAITKSYNIQSNNFFNITIPILKSTVSTGTISFDGNYIENPLSYSNYQLVNVLDSFNSPVNITNASLTPLTSSPISLVKNVSKTLSSGRVVISWKSNTESDIAGYKIYYRGYNGYSYTNSIDVGNVTSTTLPAGVGIDEDFAVTAYDASKTGTDDQFNGNESWFSPANKVPEAPTDLVADAGPRRIKLKWTASTTTGVNNYNIYRSTDNITFTKVSSTITNSFVDASLSANLKYYYKVTSFDSLDLSYDNYGLESAATSIVNAMPNRITYVSTSGSNNNIGSLSSPKLTIVNSIDNSLAGDTILLNRGTYNEVVDLKGKISLLSSMFIQTGDTNDISNTILSGATIGNNTLIINTGSPLIASYHIYALTIQDVRLQVINLSSGNSNYIFKLTKSTIKNSGSYGQWGVISLGNYGILNSCTIYGNKGRYIIANDRNAGTMASIISNNTFYSNNSSADGNSYDDVSVIHVEQPKTRVLNNLIFKNLTTAIDFGLNGSDSMIFINNTIASNKGYGIKFTSNGSPYGGYLINNIIKYNTQLDLFTNIANNGPDVYIKNNFFGASGSLFGTNLQDTSKVTILDTTGNIGGDPYFVDTLNNNYQLKGQSRSIGAGASHTYPNSKDIIGNNRINPWRTVPDIGAYESNYEFSAPLLTKTEPGNKRVALFWNKNTNANIKGYKIYRSTSSIPNDNTNTFLDDVSDINTLNYIDSSTDMVNGTKYYYRLKSLHNDNSLSGFGNELTGIPQTVALPNNFSIDNGPSTARLKWNSIGLTGAKYQLFRSTNINVKTLLVDSLVNTNFDDATLARNSKYYYWVRSMNSDGTLSEYTAPLISSPTSIWYVDSATGNDITGIGSIAAPYKKITKAVSNTINLDSVYIKDGTYIENITYHDKQLSFIGVNGASKVVLKPLLASQIMAITQNGGKSLFKGLTFTGGGNSAGSAIYTQTSNPIIENCIFRNNGTDMSGSMLQLNRNNFIITNCLVFNNSSNVFLDLANGLDSVPYINNLTYTNNSNRWFYATGITTFAPNIRNSIVWESSAINYQGGLSVENSVFKGGFPGTNSNIDSSPQFVDSANNDFHLKNYSPAIGLGSSIPSITKDFEGNNRSMPTSSSPDAGAFESIYDHSSPLITTDSSLNSYVMVKMSQTPVGTVNKFSVYKGLSSSPNTKYADTTLLTKFTDSANTIFNKVLFYRFTSTGASNLESGMSNEVRTIAFTPPVLGQPLLINKVDTNITFTWGKIDNATNYKLQYSTDSTFVTNVIEIPRIDSFYTKQGLIDNTTYYWRVQTLDSVHTSKWSSFKTFQTFVRKPILNTISTVNQVITLNWSVNSLRNIKSFKIYRGTATNPTTKIDSISSSNLVYNDSVANGIKYFYRITAINTDNVESGYSNELSANTFGVTILDSPSNNKVKEILKPIFKWEAVQFSTKSNIQISTDALFNATPILDTVTALTSLNYTKGLSDNTTYYWRVRVGDDNGYGNWASKDTFQTFVLPPTLLTLTPSNKIDTLKWSVLSISNIKYFKIYRDTVVNPLKLIDSIDGALRLYIDTANLKLNKKYYYRIVAGNTQSIESDYSNILFCTPFNTKPKAVALTDKNYSNVGEYNYVRTTYSSLGSIDVDGKVVDYKWYVNDSLVNSVDSILIYYYNQGSNKVKLVITDNDGGKDSTTANISLNSFTKTFRGGFLGGITALNQNLIYTADSTFDPVNGASITMLDRSGNTIYPLVVSSKIFTTPSVSSDSSVFITSGSSLNGFNKFGAPLWPTIPLGGLSYVTPTIDSLFSRIYVGVSNKNFFAIDYKTGKVAWSIFGDAAINSSAVITGDRKLVFTSQNGTLYGFDIKTNLVQTSPKWNSNFGDVITQSPAVDATNNLIIGTQSGKVLKIKLNSDGSITKVWTIDIASEIQSSPVIDADGFLYVGNKLGDFYKLNPDNGAVIWKYSTGAAIKSTPNISEFGTIYVANTNGLVTALKTDKTLIWTYKADGPISANMLYISNMLYIGTETGKFFAIYDNPNTNTVNTALSININKNNFKSYNTGSLASVLKAYLKPESQYYYESFKNGVFNFTFGDQVIKPKKPVWGTFQGNDQRTGSATLECPGTPVINIPNCTLFADSIKVTTSDMSNKTWVVNDINISSITDTIISVKSTDVVKLMAYNANGCNVYSTTPNLIPNSAILKPSINSSTGSYNFCEKDSVVLSSNNKYTKYQWNFSTFPVSGATNNKLSTNLQGAYSLTAVNQYGCISTSDIVIVLSKPYPTAPILSRDANNYLVASSTGVTWYKDGVQIADTTQKIKPITGGVYTAKTTQNGCVSALSTAYYFVVTDVINLDNGQFLKLVPNPFRDYLNFDFNLNGYQKMNIQVFEISTGRMVRQNKDLYPGSKLQFGALSSGTYLFKVNSNDGKASYQFKMIKL